MNYEGKNFGNYEAIVLAIHCGALVGGPAVTAACKTLFLAGRQAVGAAVASEKAAYAFGATLKQEESAGSAEELSAAKACSARAEANLAQAEEEQEQAEQEWHRAKIAMRVAMEAGELAYHPGNDKCIN